MVVVPPKSNVASPEVVRASRVPRRAASVAPAPSTTGLPRAMVSEPATSRVAPSPSVNVVPSAKLALPSTCNATPPAIASLPPLTSKPAA